MSGEESHKNSSETGAGADDRAEISSELNNILTNLAYPASKEDLLDYARDMDASPDVLEMLEQLPEDAHFQGADEVADALSTKE